MSHKIFKTTFSLSLLVALFFGWNGSLSAETENAPIIQVDKTTHIFQPVFEGEELSHTFTVFNKGRAELRIKKVTHDWGCFAAHYDRVIPPGGTGKVTLSIDSSTVRGKFEKKAVVWSNDLARRSVALYVRGEVKPYISLEPGGYLSLWGVRGQVPKESLEIINNQEKPLKITGIEDDLPGHIQWKLEEIKPGYLYRINVEDVSKDAGEYTGHLIVKTDNPYKPALVVIINGQIETAPADKDSGG